MDIDRDIVDWEERKLQKDIDGLKNASEKQLEAPKEDNSWERDKEMARNLMELRTIHKNLDMMQFDDMLERDYPLLFHWKWDAHERIRRKESMIQILSNIRRMQYNGTFDEYWQKLGK